MKTKVSLIAVVLVLLVLLAHAHFRASKLQGRLAFQSASIKAIALGHAKEDLSHGIASYVLIGEIETAYLSGLEARLQPHGIRTVAVGCNVTEAYRIYIDEYDRIVRESLIAQDGKNPIREFEAAWSNRAR